MGLGIVELAIVAASVICIVGIIVGGIALVLVLFRTRGGSSERLTALEEENRRLRADLDALKKE
jgi:hypothetical protein